MDRIARLGMRELKFEQRTSGQARARAAQLHAGWSEVPELWHAQELFFFSFLFLFSLSFSTRRLSVTEKTLGTELARVRISVWSN
jgi:hypothetical protein